jgi:hypothetical protein
MESKEPVGNKYRWMKVVGQCSFIPIFMALYPIAFYYIGVKIDEWAGTNWIKALFLFLGLFSGFRQTYLLIKQLINTQE